MESHREAFSPSGPGVRRRTGQRVRKRAELGNGAISPASDSTRERILNAAGRLLAEQGFESASMRVIAKASGITPGAVYKHFASKADLLLEVAKRAVQSIPMFIQSADGAEDATALPLLGAAYTEPGLKLLRQLSIEVHAASTKDRKVNRVLSHSDERAIGQMAESIATAQRVGKLDSALDPKLVACAFIVFIMGLTHMDTLLPHLVGDVVWREFVRDRIAKLIGVV